LLADLYRRFDVLLTGVLKCIRHDLEDRYTDECTDLSLEWRGTMWCVAMIVQEICDLCAGGEEPLVKDP